MDLLFAVAAATLLWAASVVAAPTASRVQAGGVARRRAGSAGEGLGAESAPCHEDG
jgi:hypothetical protein